MNIKIAGENSPYVFPTGLDLEWLFENGSLEDTSGNNHTGVLTNTPKVFLDRLGKTNSYWFTSDNLNNGNGQKIEIPYTPLFSQGDFTLSFNCLIQDNISSENGYIIGSSRTSDTGITGLYVHTNYRQLKVGIGYLNTGYTSFNTGVDLELYTWYNIVVKREDGYIKIYLDSELIYETVNPDFLNYSIFNSTLWVGTSYLYDRGFNGGINNIRIYGKALTDDEIKILYNEDLYPLNNSSRTSTIFENIYNYFKSNPPTEDFTINYDLSNVSQPFAGYANLYVGLIKGLFKTTPYTCNINVKDTLMTNYYNFEGNLDDIKGNGPSGVFYQNGNYGYNKWGEYGYGLDGTYSVISGAIFNSYNATFDGDFTISIIFRNDDTNYYQYIADLDDKLDGFSIAIGYNRLLYFRSSNTGDWSTPYFTSDINQYKFAWIHYVFVRENGYYKLYQNGNLVYERPNQDNNTYIANTLRVGYGYPDVTRGVREIVDNIIIYNGIAADQNMVNGLYHMNGWPPDTTEKMDLIINNHYNYFLSNTPTETVVHNYKIDGFGTPSYGNLNPTIRDLQQLFIENGYRFDITLNSESTLMGYWPLNIYGSTTVIDESLYGHNGTYYSGEFRIPDRFGKTYAHYFTPNRYANMFDIEVDHINNPFAISFWWKCDTAAQNILTLGSNIFKVKQYDVSDRLRITYMDNNLDQYDINTITGSAPLGIWHHCVILFDNPNNNAKVYIDNVNYVDTTINELNNVDTTLQLAHTQDNGAYGRVSLGDIRVYSHNLSIDEIDNLYQENNWPPDTEFKMNYIFDNLSNYYTTYSTNKHEYHYYDVDGFASPTMGIANSSIQNLKNIFDDSTYNLYVKVNETMSRFYKLDGDSNDSSINLDNGTPVSSLLLEPDKNGLEHSTYFPGSAISITPIVTSTYLSISFDFKISAYGSYIVLGESADINTRFFSVLGKNTIRMGTSTDYTSPIDIELNGWYKAVVIKNSSSTSIYIDNTLTQTQNFTSVPTYDKIGTGKFSSQDFHGNLKNLRIFEGKVLTTEEIGMLYTEDNWPADTSIKIESIISNHIDYYTTNTPVRDYTVNYQLKDLGGIDITTYNTYKSQLDSLFSTPGYTCNFYANTYDNTGLQAYYTFETDFTDQINTFNPTTNVDVIIDSDGAYFNGSTSYLRIDSDPLSNIENDYTICAWIKVPIDATLAGTLYARINDIDDESIISTTIYPDTITMDDYLPDEGSSTFNLPTVYETTLNTNEWIHVVLQKDENDGRYIWINGVLGVYEENCEIYGGQYLTDLIIGRDIRNTVSQSSFYGWMKNLRFYNRVLSGQEIVNIYNANL